MKLFFFIESLYRAAGTERIATDVVNALYEKTHWEIQFIILSANTNTSFNLNKDIPIKSLNCKPTQPIKAIRNLHQLIKEEKPQYIINIAVVMSRFSIPAAIFTHTKVITWEHFNLFAGSKLGYLWRLTSAGLSYKTIVLTIQDKTSYPKCLQKKIQTIYNFPTPIENRLSKLESNIAISVGRLTYQKGFDLLLESWKHVQDINKSWSLFIIGSGEDEIILKQKAKDLELTESVKFIPNTPNIKDYYQQASLYIMSSRFEGLPLVLIEAKQQGLPCVSFNCPNGPNEIIRPNIDGDLIPFGDTKKMAKAIINLMNNRNKIKQYGTEAYNDIKNRFSKDIIIQQWINLLK